VAACGSGMLPDVNCGRQMLLLQPVASGHPVHERHDTILAACALLRPHSETRKRSACPKAVVVITKELICVIQYLFVAKISYPVDFTKYLTEYYCFVSSACSSHWTYSFLCFIGHITPFRQDNVRRHCRFTRWASAWPSGSRACCCRQAPGASATCCLMPQVTPRSWF